MADIRTDVGCASCGEREYYEISRHLEGEWLRVRWCRTCDADSAPVAELDRLTDVIFAE